MALQMKAACEICGKGLGQADEAYICSYECTFCGQCSVARQQICPNCGGELLRWPRRKVAATT